MASRGPVEYAALHVARAKAAYQTRDFATVETQLQKALALVPASADALLLTAELLLETGRADKASVVNATLRAKHPGLFAAHDQFVRILVAQSRQPEAAQHLGEMGAQLLRQGDMPGAADLFLRAVQLHPQRNELQVLYVGALRRSGHAARAIEHLQRQIPLSTAPSMLMSTLGAIFQDTGQIAEAVREFAAAIAADPANPVAHSNYLYALHYTPPLDAPAIFAEHRKWAARHAEPLRPAEVKHENTRDPGRRLRIGYSSPNFYAQAVSFFTVPILHFHDAEQFEVFCYADVLRPDTVTSRLKTHIEKRGHWRETSAMPADKLAERIREDKIDILVDLTGHISDHRLLAFARRPAPVQVTYIGYQNTTGMSAMDYRLTDAVADPPGQTDAFYTEELYRLPQAFFCYHPLSVELPTEPLPAAATGHITFGSLNLPAKINAQVAALWSRILREMPQAKLMLLVSADGAGSDRLRELFSPHGVVDRIIFQPRLPRPDYLATYRKIDVALDPFPFSGHTTTCDALWMGTPVVTLSGRDYVSRMSTSVLANLEMHECIAATEDDYVRRAVALASDLPRLRELRTGLRARFSNSHLMNARLFTTRLEEAYRAMWTRWCASR